MVWFYQKTKEKMMRQRRPNRIGIPILLSVSTAIAVWSAAACKETTDATDGGVDTARLDAGTQSDAGDSDTGSGVGFELCDPVDLAGFGDCGNALGVAFDGDICNYARGCNCEPHCHQMFNSIEECEITCLGYTTCDASNGLTCEEGSYCAFTPEDNCGATGATAVCKPTPMICAAIDDPVCGCDGQTYENECKANAAGTGIRSNDPC